MKKFALFLFAVPVILSCEKQKTEASAIALLKEHEWFVYRVHANRFDDSTNALLSDTAYIVETCIQNSSFRFLEDSVFKRTMHCNLAQPFAAQGKWHWSSIDSLLFSISQYPAPPGSGYLIYDFGFGYCKLLEISAFQLAMKQTDISYDGNGTRNRWETTYFCRPKN